MYIYELSRFALFYFALFLKMKMSFYFVDLGKKYHKIWNDVQFFTKKKLSY